MAEDIIRDIRRIAEEEGVDPDLAVRTAKQESGFRQDATSRRGARGIFQLMPDTARELGVDLNDPTQNIRGGVRYLRQQLGEFGDPTSALAAYNAGPNRFRDFLRTGRALPQETLDYTRALTGRTPEVPVSGLSEAELSGLSPRMRPLFERAERLRGAMGQSETEVARLTGEREAAVARGATDVAERGTAAQREAIAAYQAQRQMPDKFEPTQETAGDLSALFGLLGVFGALLGAGGKRNALNAMNAMTGMMSGWRQGRQDLYNREKQVFETNMRQLEARNTELRRDMEGALKIAQSDMDAGMARVREIAARFNMPILMEQAKRNDLKGMLETVQSLQQVSAQMDQHDRTLAAEAARRTRVLEEQVATEQRRRLAAAGPMADQIIERQSPEAAARTRELLSRVDLGARGRQNLEASYAALEGSERVARSISQNRDAVDALASAMNRARADQVAGLLQRFFGGQSTQDQLFNGLDRIIDQAGLAGDVASRAKIIQKELFSLALADAQATGRPTVFLERALSGFYAQNLRPDTLIELIKDRAKEAVTRIPNAVLRPDTLTNYRQDFSLLATPNSTEFMRLHPMPNRRGGNASTGTATTPSAPPEAQRTRALQAIERARAELGENATDDAVVTRARELMQ